MLRNGGACVSPFPGWLRDCPVSRWVSCGVVARVFSRPCCRCPAPGRRKCRRRFFCGCRLGSACRLAAPSPRLSHTGRAPAHCRECSPRPATAGAGSCSLSPSVWAIVLTASSVSMGVIVGMARAVVKPAWLCEATADGKTVGVGTGHSCRRMGKARPKRQNVSQQSFGHAVGEPISTPQSRGFYRGCFKAWVPSNRR